MRFVLIPGATYEINFRSFVCIMTIGSGSPRVIGHVTIGIGAFQEKACRCNFVNIYIRFLHDLWRQTSQNPKSFNPFRFRTFRRCFQVRYWLMSNWRVLRPVPMIHIWGENFRIKQSSLTLVWSAVCRRTPELEVGSGYIISIGAMGLMHV